MTRGWQGAVIVGLCLLAAAAGLAAVGARAQRVSAGGCSDPVVHDRYGGFHVGVPAGWYLSSTSGAIAVFPDYSGRTEALVQTAYVASGQSPRSFLSKVLTVLARNAKAAGNVLTF